MTDLRALLDVASRPEPTSGLETTHDLTADLQLGRRALRRRRLAAAGGGLAAATLAVGTVAGGAALFGSADRGATGLAPAASSTPSGPPTGASSPPVTTPPPADTIEYDRVALVDMPVQAGPFRFGKTPSGWTSGASIPVVGNLVPRAGGVDADPYVSNGKVSVTLDHGQAAYTDTEDGVSRTATPIVHNGETVTLTLQVPESLLSLEDIHALAGSITVDESAQVAPG